MNFFQPELINKAVYKTAQLLGPSLKDKQLGVFDKDVLDFVIVIIWTEHLIILIKYLMMTFIGDTPGRIVKI